MNFREQYFDVWSQAWQFHKRFADMKGTDEEWEAESMMTNIRKENNHGN